MEAGDDADAIATGSVPAEPGNIPVPASESAPKFSPILEMKGGAGEAMQQRRSPYTNSVDELADELHIPDPPATSRHESQQSDTLESAERLLADLNKDNWPLPPTTADTTDVVREGKPQPQSVVCIRVDTNLSAHITPAPTTSKLQSSGQVVDVQSYENLKGYGHSVKAMLGCVTVCKLVYVILQDDCNADLHC